MEQTTIDQLRQRLDEERTSISTQLTDMGVDPETGQPDGEQFAQGFADSGQSTAERTQVVSMAEGLMDMIREIDVALRRIEEGTYGSCITCGNPIPEERMEARPAASECMTCKKRSG